MASKERSGYCFKFILYLVVIILINIASYTLFFRVDLTSGRIYSLSSVSKEVVSTLSEPLTIHVFLTKNLPAPYNNIERYLRDLLQEYSVSANKYFNYRFYNVTAEDGVAGEEVRKNQELARELGIYSTQIQVLERDEISFRNAYMGLAMVHGDIIEKMPEISSTDRLEYRLTTAIQRMNNKIGALLRLESNIQLKLYLSSSLMDIAPLMGINRLDRFADDLKDIVEDLNRLTYGRLELNLYDPSADISLEDEMQKYEIISLEWPDVPEDSVTAGKGSIGLIAEYDDRILGIPLIRQMRVPFLGIQYELIDPEILRELIYESIESLIDINESLGYLASHGSINLRGGGVDIPGMQGESYISNFDRIASHTYSLKEVRLTDDEILDSLNTVIIAGPKEQFTEYDLFQIDQFLMRGNNLVLFLDPFKEAPRQQGGSGGIPNYTGLETLLEHYGISMNKSLVFDKSCYVTSRPREYGGGELPYYFIIRILDRFINKDLAFMENIRALFVPEASPLNLNYERIRENGLTAHRILSSSEEAWEQEVPNLNPLFLEPPAPFVETRSYPLAYLLEGEFPGYFAERPIPEITRRDEMEKADMEEAEYQESGIDLSRIKRDRTPITGGKPGRIFLIGTSEVLKDNVFDREGVYPNAVFIMNIIDYLNNREETAVMRAKDSDLNPLFETSPGTRSFIKYFNMIGLPALVIIFGLCVWFFRIRRKMRIQELFTNQAG